MSTTAHDGGGVTAWGVPAFTGRAWPIADALDPLLVERRRLGALELHTIRARSLVEAHGELGARMAGPARTAIQKRLAATSPTDLVRQIRAVRESRAFMEAQAASSNLAGEVRTALGEYLGCLDAWCRTVRAGEWLPDALEIDGRRVSADDLALWAQDDNTGCQSGSLRQDDGSVLFWHTEEDRLHYLDRPRLATFAVGSETLTAFLYPYLLPGPAFGFGAGQVHAIDSLVLKGGLAPRGTFTSVASFLVWRLGAAVPARETLRALAPYLDGCAINVARPTGRDVLVETHEIGGGHVQTRTLAPTAGAFSVQANAVLDAASPLARHQALSPEDRVAYDRRVARAGIALRGRLGAAEPGPEHVLRLVASRRGGRRAFANATVKGHLVARVSARGFEIHVGPGAALPSDVYRPRWGAGTTSALSS